VNLTIVAAVGLRPPLNSFVRSPLSKTRAVQIQQQFRWRPPGSAALAAFDTGGFDPAQQARAAPGSDPKPKVLNLRQRRCSRQYFFDGRRSARHRRAAQIEACSGRLRQGLWWLCLALGALKLMTAIGFT